MALIEAAIGGLCAVCISFLVGLIIGWTWKPRWEWFWRDVPIFNSAADSSNLAIPASLSTKDLGLSSAPCLNSSGPATFPSWVIGERDTKTTPLPASKNDDCSKSQLNEGQPNVVKEEDLQYLIQLVKMKGGGPPWIHMMHRVMPNMSYQAWWRDPKNGPCQYRSRTVFENAAPELVRDFFWDDEFRPKWDNMLASSTTIEECPNTGNMVVQWIRKFPIFCSDREYIISRRIWELGRSFYCVTMGVPYASISSRNGTKRVDLYYSSWCIRAVESRSGDGQMTACEVLLFHHEDMGIPRELAKLGIRQGMWGAVKKIEPGLRTYQKERSSGAPLSPSVLMAQITTKINVESLISTGCTRNLSEEEVSTADKPPGRNIPKLIIFGAAVILACSLDRGLLTKVFTFGAARSFANMGRRL